MNQLPQVLRSRREELRFTQADLATRLGVSQSTVARWESGKRQPSGTLLTRVMRLLRLTLDEVE